MEKVDINDKIEFLRLAEDYSILFYAKMKIVFINDELTVLINQYANNTGFHPLSLEETRECVERASKLKNIKLTKNGKLDVDGIKMAEKIQAKDAVCMHVRRGDYVNNPKTFQYHGVCSIAYYKRAEKIIAENVRNPHFFIFSDDTQWCVSNMVFDHDVTIVPTVSSGGKADYHLHLMTLCKHYIIANSSFSWWAAWLSPNKEKIVIAPKKWFRDEAKSTKDLIPERWLRV